MCYQNYIERSVGDIERQAPSKITRQNKTNHFDKELKKIDNNTASKTQDKPTK